MNTHILIAMLQLVDVIIGLYVWTLIAYIIASWLIHFRIINPYQPIVQTALTALAAIHEPFLRPVRRLMYRFLPDMGGIDLSPIVTLLLAQYFVGPLLKDLLLMLA